MTKNKQELKEMEKCEHNVYVQNCDICRTKELENTRIVSKYRGDRIT